MNIQVNYESLSAVQKVEYVQQVIRLANTDSLDRQIFNKDGSNRYTLVGDSVADESIVLEDIVEQQLIKEKVSKAIERLSPREQVVIRMRFGLDDGVPKTLEEIGEKYSLTRERIRQIERIALKKLRTNFNKKGIKRAYDL